MNEQQTHQVEQFKRPFDTTVDYKYICIKKEFFNPDMIYLNYTVLKLRKYIEIIYKSPSIFLDGLFFKTPKIKVSQIYISRKHRQPNNVSLRITLNPADKEQAAFIALLQSIDIYINQYIGRCSREITKELNEIPEQAGNCIEMFRYDAILKQSYMMYELHMKSYLDAKTLNNLYTHQQNNSNADITLTFNISNIYLGYTNLIPLVKCNRCEIHNINHG